MNKLYDFCLWLIGIEDEPPPDGNLLSGCVFLVLLFKPEIDE